MAFRESVALVLAIFLVQSIKPTISTEKNVSVQTNDSSGGGGFGFEILLSKMDFLEYKFLELDFEIKEQNEQIMRNQEQLEKTHSGMTWMLTRMEQAVGQNFTEMMDQSWKILQQQKSCSIHDTLRNEIFKLKPIRSLSKPVQPLMELQQVTDKKAFESCKDEPSKVSGKYMLQSFGKEGQFKGYCEQTKFGGGWIVIQHRYNGSLNFYRNWTEYQRGFGEPDKEYWIGLDLLHNLTTGQTYHLMVELEDYNGNYKYAMYSGFEIGSEAEKYSLKTLGSYNGTAGDSMAYHKGKMFSTFDSDNDSYSTANCAQTYTGAWWYDSCLRSNLNGAYMTGTATESMNWYYFGNAYTGLKYSRMMIRKV